MQPVRRLDKTHRLLPTGCGGRCYLGSVYRRRRFFPDQCRRRVGGSRYSDEFCFQKRYIIAIGRRPTSSMPCRRRSVRTITASAASFSAEVSRKHAATGRGNSRYTCVSVRHRSTFGHSNLDMSVELVLGIRIGGSDIHCIGSSVKNGP